MFKTLNYLLVIYKKKAAGCRLQKILGWKGPSVVFGQTPIKSTASFWAGWGCTELCPGNICKGGGSTASLGNVVQCLPPLPVKKYFPYTHNVQTKSHLAAIQLKLLNYYIQSSCRCYRHSIILSYKSLQVNRKVRMQFAGAHWYLHSSYCDSWLLVRNWRIETIAWLAAAENLVHFSFSWTFLCWRQSW